MPALGVAQPLRWASGRGRVAAGAGRLLACDGRGSWPCCSSRASTALSAAPKAGLNRSDLSRHYNGRVSGGAFLLWCWPPPACPVTHPDLIGGADAR